MASDCLLCYYGVDVVLKDRRWGRLEECRSQYHQNCVGLVIDSYASMVVQAASLAHIVQEFVLVMVLEELSLHRLGVLKEMVEKVV
jgi:hypothetical protein